MIKKSLLFGAIASVVAINSVFADTIVTSQSYVDNHDALKQDKITAGTTGNVVTYNGTQNGQAQFSERGIFNPVTGFDVENGEVVSGHEGDLVTAGLFVSAMDDFQQNITGLGEQIDGLGEQIEQATNLPRTTTTNKVCTEWVSGQAHTDANCLLWNLVDQTVYGCLAEGASCTSHGQCCDGWCDGGVCAIPQN